MAAGAQAQAQVCTVDEPAARAGVSVRAIRFYGTRGLPPPPAIGPAAPAGTGPSTWRGRALIEELQHRGVPLAAIERYLERLPRRGRRRPGRPPDPRGRLGAGRGGAPDARRTGAAGRARAPRDQSVKVPPASALSTSVAGGSKRSP
ncbi:hypothetical protein LUX12_00385 [Streptomyces somaliensis]|nr:hypothetical protein [Streptomyces somaliensis]MCP9943605.1 hypothetical protein [Streptomyces somaliensis]